MDKRYQQFCFADPLFYDAPSRSRLADGHFAAARPVPEGWRSEPMGPWTVLSPPGARLPAQGWKIHVAATPDTAADMLGVVWDYCVGRAVPFKFLSERLTVLLNNSKNADRASSGKFVTIYPVDEAELERILHELDAELAGRAGPYILSDVRWRAGPLYVRYGGFVRRNCTLPDGERVPAIADPDGRLVPDRREPRFHLPPWVVVPDFLTSAVAARQHPDEAHEFPFQIERPLHYSNGGGIYLATDNRDGRRVVLKEARPHAGFDAAGQSAVRRLEREREFLAKLAGTGIVPELHGHFVCWEHHFLVEEYVEGETLGRSMVLRAPLLGPETDPEAVAEYTRWASDVLVKVRQALGVLHDAGVVFGDLHPHNIMVRPDGRVAFVDFEAASYVADDAPPAMGAVGYLPADRRTGADVDHYAMAALSLALFLPLNVILPLHPAMPAMLAGWVGRRFAVPGNPLDGAVEVLRVRPGPDPGDAGRRYADGAEAVALAEEVYAGTADWARVRDSIRDAILASATPERADRLFPGDIEQFTYNGVGLAYGAAGVLYGLARSGGGRFPDHERWLLDAVHAGRHNGHVGFYDGLHGVAYALAALDRPDDASAVLDQAMAAPLDDLPANLFAGLAGVGLNLLHFAALTGDGSLRERAVAIGARLADLSTGAEPAPGADSDDRARPRAGLMYGPSGRALLHVRLFEATGDRRFLDLAEAELRRDLDRCVTLTNGSMQLNEGWRTMPYVATGSIGVGLVLREFLRHGEHDGFADALARIRLAACSEFVICPGLFNGRAGLIALLVLLRATDPPGSADLTPVLDRHLRRLAWHFVPYQGGVAFPGDQLARLSMDLATGSTGVLVALSAALDGTGVTLPFLTPPPSAQTFPHPTTKQEGGDPQ